MAPRGVAPCTAAMAICIVVFGGLATLATMEEQCDSSDALCQASREDRHTSGMESGVSEQTHADPGKDDVDAGAELAPGRLALALVFLGAVTAWIVFLLKSAWDGSLPARLALWGFLPEAYAAISVRSVVALLRLKDHSTPVILLRECVTDANAQDLAEAMRKYTKAEVEALELPSNPRLGVIGVGRIVEAAMCEESQLSELDLSMNSQLGDAVISVLRPLLEGTKLASLKLAECGLTGAGIQELAQIVTKSRLRTLDLSANNFVGVNEALAAIVEAPPYLEELVLQSCNLGAGEVSSVSEELPYTSIRSLKLGGNGFGSEGLVALCKHLTESQIDELGLEYTSLEVGCDGLSALAASWANRPFARLWLAGNKLSPEQSQEYIRTLKSLRA